MFGRLSSRIFLTTPKAQNIEKEGKSSIQLLLDLFWALHQVGNWTAVFTARSQQVRFFSASLYTCEAYTGVL